MTTQTSGKLTCLQCVHYFASEATRGECRAHPPSTIVTVPGRGDPSSAQVTTRSQFPIILPDWWCGEGLPREVKRIN